MKIRKDISVILMAAVLLTILFHRQSLGVNLLLFESFVYFWFLFTGKISWKNQVQIAVTAAFLLTTTFSVITHSTFSIIINLFVLFLFVGVINYPQIKSVLNTFSLSGFSLFSNQLKFIKLITSSKIRKRNIGTYLKGVRIFLIPLVVIFIFIKIYESANPIFDEFSQNVNSMIGAGFTYVFKNFDGLILLTFLIALLISNFIFLRNTNQRIITNDVNSNEVLERQRNQSRMKFRTMGLKSELKAGVFLLIVLNSLLLIVNIIDINWVWFNFQWEGQYLKQFVHEGTYLLILSTLISIAIVLYYFRRNLNFYKKNQFIRILSYIWIIQNVILTLSVGLRNFYYIRYFALAYKRIGVIMFLILVVFGLITVFIKIQKRKSGFYLFRTNGLAIVLILVLSSIINWDSYIAKYNFRNSNKSFLHLNFMAELSDNALPYLDVSLEDLKEIQRFQNKKFPNQRGYLSPFEYNSIINHRKIEFKKKWESKSFLSWNLPEYLAYKKLFSEQ